MGESKKGFASLRPARSERPCAARKRAAGEDIGFARWLLRGGCLKYAYVCLCLPMSCHVLTLTLARMIADSRKGWFSLCHGNGNMGGQEPLAIPYLAMSTGRHSFKHNDAKRLIRAAEAAGKTVTGVTLNKDGAVTVLVDGVSSSAPKRDDEVETWIERQHANQG